jgi:hypothetical protein
VFVPRPPGLDRFRLGLKERARRGLDRAARPYVEELVGRLGDTLQLVEHASAQSTEVVPEVSLHNVLHTARTMGLSCMPAVTGTLLSAGPNGKWYFDWFDSAYGQVERHIALEAYAPRPDDLPSNVEWIDTDIAAPDGIAAVGDAEVDLLFSGQNIEHLWPHQVVSFLLESSRVIKPGGWLVIDSPNRDLTTAYRWSMSEHTVEFTVDEARSLLEIAGFEVRLMRGLWLCRRGGQVLPLEPVRPGGLETLDRLALSARHPEDSFIWWAESVKVGNPNEQALRAAVLDIYRQHWRERVSRLQMGAGAAIDDSGHIIRIQKGTTGYPVLGPFMPLPPGTYQFRLPIAWDNCADFGSTIATFEVVVNDQCVASIPIVARSRKGSSTVTTEVHVPNVSFASHVRLLCAGTASMDVPLDLTIEPEPWRVPGLTS